MPCRVCNGPVEPLFPDWFRCRVCGSDTSSFIYEEIKSRYQTEEYLDHNLQNTGSREDLLRTMETNFKLFEIYKGWAPDFTFLDIGCLEGCGMEGMQNNFGWSIHGFDVTPLARTGSHVTVASRFDARLFPRRYGAVLCREVIEHVPDWQDLLDQCHQVVLPFGLFQLQTPRPCSTPDPIVYQEAHLQIFNPERLVAEVSRRGFELLESLLWQNGQCYLFRHTG